MERRKLVIHFLNYLLVEEKENSEISDISSLYSFSVVIILSEVGVTTLIYLALLLLKDE